ncbi:hypothetical protein Tco_1507493 [Tanacetum coccineum]
MDSQSTQTVKLDILQPENGNARIVTKTIDGKETVIPPTSVEEKAQKKGIAIEKQDLEGSQITDKSRKGVGFVSYNIVPPPYKGLFLPPKFDFSNSGLEEFQQHEFEGYGPKPSKSVSKDISNEVREYLMPHCLRQGSTKRSQGYVDMVLNAHGTGNMSYLSDFKEFDGGYVTFRGGAKGGKITSKRTLKTGDVKGRWDFYYPRQLVLLAWLNAIGRKVSAARQKFNAIRPRVNTPRSDEERIELKELMDMCTKLFDRVLDLENVKDAQALEIKRLKKRVKKLEKKKKSRTP